jgi:hypothetical protein
MENSEVLGKQYMRDYWKKTQKTYYEKNKEKVNLKNSYNQYMRKYGEIPEEKRYKFKNYVRFLELDEDL